MKNGTQGNADQHRADSRAEPGTGQKNGEEQRVQEDQAQRRGTAQRADAIEPEGGADQAGGHADGGEGNVIAGPLPGRQIGKPFQPRCPGVDGQQLNQGQTSTHSG